MKNLILFFCIPFYCIVTLSAQSDSLIIVLEKTLHTQIGVLGEEHLDVAMYCDSLGMMYMDAGKYGQADSLFNKALAIKAKKLEENHPDIADSYHNIGEVYSCKSNYLKADSLLTRALNIRLKVLDEKHTDIAMSYNGLGVVYWRKGNHEKAISFHSKALNIRLMALGQKHSSIAQSYNNLGVVYYSKGDYKKAIDFYDKALNTLSEVLGEKHPNVAKFCNNLGSTYIKTGDYEKAISFHDKALNIQLEVLGEKHPDIAQSYNSLATMHRIKGDYEKAISFSNKALNVSLEVFDGKHVDIARSCNNLGILHHDTGDYEKAISFFNKALSINLELFGEKHSYIAVSYGNLGNMYLVTNDYEKAISFHNKALNIRLEVLGEKHPAIAISHNNLGNIYIKIGDYRKAISFHNKALSINLELFGEKHPEIADSYNNLGSTYIKTGDYEKAISFHSKALSINLEALGEKHINIAKSYNNLGIAYDKTGDYKKAISFYNRALIVYADMFGEEHYKTAKLYNNLGVVYEKTGEYEKAISFHTKALNIRREVFGEKHPYLNDSYCGLAMACEEIGDYQTADSLWRRIINQDIKRLNDTYLFLPDNQRLEYAKTFKGRHGELLSFTAKNGSENTKKLAAYLLLNTKSLALGYSISTLKLINNMGNEELKKLHNELNTLNKNISQAELMTTEERKEKNWNLTAMRDQQENLSRELLKNETLREKLYKIPVTWEDARSQLKSNEVILDFVRFYEDSDSTWMYYAMLTRKNMSAPEFIRVTDEEAIIASLQAGNQYGQPNYIQIDKGLKALYQKIWQPLTPYLKGIKTVHFSPSGLLHRIDFEVLQDENDKYLAEHFEFHYYTTMRDFTGKKKTNFLSKIFKKRKYKEAVFFGDIAYNFPSEKQQSDTTGVVFANTLRDEIEPIPNTKEEIFEAGKINKESGGLSTYITGNDATEDTVKYYSPDILHFATHGKYLLPLDSLGKQATGLQNRLHTSGNPLQRSMLILSEGGETWTSKEYIPRSDEDGILTAYEVTHLDLSDTKLVVLSACNTGLGDIHDTEGVLGLQSAFKLAGVEHVVASLWKVNDKATKELMVAFYNNLLSKKQDAPTALRNAKAKMRQNGAKSANWAGFILIE